MNGGDRFSRTRAKILVAGYISLVSWGQHTTAVRKLIPVDNGESSVAQYAAGLNKIELAFRLSWAKFHNGWGGEDNCEHLRPEFLVWHHAFLVLTEELFEKSLGARFAMPYWSPAQSGRVPSVFSCTKPECSVLNVPERFPVGKSDFSTQYSKWQGKQSCPLRSFFCMDRCLAGGIGDNDPEFLGGDYASIGDKGGWIEDVLHDPVHGASNVNGDFMYGTKAAKDPFFHPFHAGLDEVFVRLLFRSQQMRCEVCANMVEPGEGSSYKVWKTAKFKLPEPACLSYDSAGQTFRAIQTTVNVDGVAINCQDLRKVGGIPFTYFTIGQILRDARFWRTGFPGDSGGAPVGIEPPCGRIDSGEETCVYDEQKNYSCPASTRLISLRIAPGPEVRFQGEAEPLRKAYFRLRIEGLDLKRTANTLYRVALVSDGEQVEVGRVQFSAWRDSLQGGHANHHVRNTYQLLVGENMQAKVAALLARQEKVKVKITPVNKTRKKPPRQPSSILLEGFVPGPEH